MASTIRKKLGPAKKRLEVKIQEATIILKENKGAQIQEELDIQVTNLQVTSNKLRKSLEKYNNLIFELEKTEENKEKLDEDLENLVVMQDEASDLLDDIDFYIKSFTKKIDHNLEMEKIKAHNNGKIQDTARETNVKLPKLNLQTFSGDILEFQEFWDSFDSAIHSNTTLRNVDKLTYLHSRLEGEAKNVIDGLALTNDNYNVAINLLKDRYVNHRKVVNARLEALLSVSTGSSIKSLRQTVDIIEVHLRALEAIGENVNNSVMAYIIWKKLPISAKIRLEERFQEVDWNLENLRKEIKNYLDARVGSEHENNHDDCYGGKTFAPRSTADVLVATEFQAKKKRCIYCKAENHWSDQCNKYDTIEERKVLLKGHCFKCLQTHGEMPCKQTKSCVYCKKFNEHHRSLCPSHFSKQNLSEVVKSENGLLATGEQVIMQTATVTIKNPENQANASVRIMFDSGSSRSFVTEELVRRLQLKSTNEKKLSLFTFGSDVPREVSASTVSADLQHKTGEYSSLYFDIVPQITGNMMRAAVNCNNLKKSWPLAMSNLADTLPAENETSSIEILIGNDYYWDLITGEKIEISTGLYLVNSKFGWIISGRSNVLGSVGNVPDASSLLLLTSREIPDNYFTSPLVNKDSEKLEIEHFWKLETIGINEALDETDDARAMDIFNDTIKYENGRYFVSWPWKNENPNLHDNYFLSLNRLKCLMSRLQKQPDVLNKYTEIIQDQLKKGVIEKVENGVIEGPRKHYVPHHAVITPQKTTTKVRIVYDASAKTKGHNSLNECLFRGPVILEELCALLIRFRLGSIALVADIEKAFLQVGLIEESRDVTRFLWPVRTDEPISDGNIQIYRFTRVPFGIISSPFLLAATIHHHLKQNSNIVSEKITNSLYVDNVLACVDSLDEAKEFYTEAKLLFESASMNLREWTSNEKKFREFVPQDDKVKESIVKILGMQWYVENDKLCLRDSYNDEVSVNITKRIVLKRIAAIFDPLGLANPVMIRAKLFLQRLWELNIDWDSALPECEITEWLDINDNVKNVTSLQIPRCIVYKKSPDTKYDLICFCDASNVAYGAVLYLKVQRHDDCQVNVIYSKTRVAPRKKSLSVPRLELLAMWIGCKCVKWLTEKLGIKIDNKYLWTDSQCSLHWILSKRPLSVFVRNRINEIKCNKDITFSFIAGEDNPADLITRGKSVEEIKSCDLWWKGPTWLVHPQSHWPSWEEKAITPDMLSQIELEVVKSPPMYEISCLSTVEASIMPFGMEVERYSTLGKLLRITALVYRFLQKLKKLSTEKILSSVELENARKMWLRAVQKQCYPTLLTNEESSEEKNLRKQLDLFFDDENIIRCHGRLYLSELKHDARYPVFLPRKHFFTRLVIEDVHRKLCHAGTAHTLAIIRDEFWIPQGRSAVRITLQRCYICKKYEGGSYRLPPMAPLPHKRVTSSTPFLFTGLDYLGPLYVKTGRHDVEKVWICLFTCMVIRAVHLEVVRDLSSEHFVLALRRFVARRGVPKEIVSDNAPHFKHVDRALQRGLKSVEGACEENDEDVQNYMSAEGIKWSFICEYAPWMGGFYERLVQCVKRALRKVIDNKCLNFEQLRTVLAEVEAVVNSRPLCYVGDDKEQTILKPCNFLALNQKTSVPEVDVDLKDPEFVDKVNSADQLLQSWKKGQNLITNFWKCWRNDYLKSLRERFKRNVNSKGKQVVNLIRVGNVVLIKSNLPRGKWKIGRVTKLISSADGKVRSAKVKRMKGSECIRPINHLYPMEIQDDC